jgi:hypothetical protein
MPTFTLPLSRDVAINPWTAFMWPIAIAGQTGSANVRVGQSSEPAVEGDVLSGVASYGKQLGRIGDALIVLLTHFRPATPLTKEETDAIDDLREMLQKIADVKDKYNRKAMRPGAHVPSPVSPTPEPAGAPPPPKAAAPEPTRGSANRSSAPASSRRAPRKRTPQA